MVKRSKVSNKKSKDQAKKISAKELALYKEKAAENLAGWQRAKADYQNLIKRTAAEKETAVKMANEQLILEMLPLVDNFKHACDHLPADLEGNDWIKGVLFIRDQLEKLLENEGAKPIASVGKKFDPEKHEAVERIKTKESGKKDIVVEEVQVGYTLRGKVIRPARVKVAV